MNSPVFADWKNQVDSLFIRKSHFVLHDILSMTPRNVVLLAQNPSNGSRIVFKVAPFSGCLFSEVVCLSGISHPNIVSLKEWWTDRRFVYLGLEYIPGRCLIDLLIEEERFSENLTKSMFKQIVAAVDHLHKNGYVHRDLKPDNMILDTTTGKLKLIDFELATRFQKGEAMSQRSGTLHYLSPEVRRKKYEGPESDAWSLGVCLFVLLSGQFPFSKEVLWAFSEKDQSTQIVGVSDEVNHLIKHLLQVNPRRRLRVDQIPNHLWMKRDDALPKGKEPFGIKRSIPRIRRLKLDF